MLIYYCSFLLSVDMGSVVNPFLKAFHLRCNCWRCGGGGEGDTGRGSAPRYYIPCKVLQGASMVSVMCCSYKPNEDFIEHSDIQCQKSLV